MTFTKEQLISAAHARMEFAEMMMAKYLLPLQIRNLSIELELARIALASLEAEPAGYHVIIERGAVGCNVATLKEAEETRDLWNKSWTIKPYFYTAPQPLTTSERAELENYRNAQAYKNTGWE